MPVRSIPGFDEDLVVLADQCQLVDRNTLIARQRSRIIRYNGPIAHAVSEDLLAQVSLSNDVDRRYKQFVRYPCCPNPADDAMRHARYVDAVNGGFVCHIPDLVNIVASGRTRIECEENLREEVNRYFAKYFPDGIIR